MTRVPIGRSSSRKSSPENRTRGGDPFSVITTCDSSSYNLLSVFSGRMADSRSPQIQDWPLVGSGERAQPDVRIHRRGPPDDGQHGVVGAAVRVGVALVQGQLLPHTVIADRI